MWWYLLLILPALLLLFLLLPVYLTVSLKDGEPEIKVKLAFINITGAVVKEGGQEKSDSGKKPEKRKKRSVSDKINEFRDKVAFGREVFRIAARRLTVTHFRVHCRVSTGDAAQTAILYGSACAAAAALDAFVNECFKVKKQNIYVYPDFTRQEPELEAYVRVRVFVFSAVGAVISIFFSAIKRGPKRARA